MVERRQRDDDRNEGMAGAAAESAEADVSPTCFNPSCDNPGTKRCGRCKRAFYCSSDCQVAHWRSGHKRRCKATAEEK